MDCIVFYLHCKLLNTFWQIAKTGDIISTKYYINVLYESVVCYVIISISFLIYLFFFGLYFFFIILFILNCFKIFIIYSSKTNYAGGYIFFFNFFFCFFFLLINFFLTIKIFENSSFYVINNYWSLEDFILIFITILSLILFLNINKITIDLIGSLIFLRIFIFFYFFFLFKNPIFIIFFFIIISYYFCFLKNEFSNNFDYNKEFNIHIFLTKKFTKKIITIIPIMSYYFDIIFLGSNNLNFKITIEYFKSKPNWITNPNTFTLKKNIKLYKTLIFFSNVFFIIFYYYLLLQPGLYYLLKFIIFFSTVILIINSFNSFEDKLNKIILINFFFITVLIL